MNVSHKKIGLGMMALAVALMGSAVIAGDKGTKQKPPMGGPMGMMAPTFDFTAADADKDGKVTQAEFTAYRAAQVGAIDADHDGKLSVAELAAMHVKDDPTHANDIATKMVADRDIDGDGKLSVGELVSMPMPPDEFALADTNKDGVIDQAEATAAMAAMMAHGHDGKGGKNGKHNKGDAPANGQAGN